MVQEEIQRLHDFVEIFDLLLVANEDKKDFKFWRRYIRDKVDSLVKTRFEEVPAI